MSSLAATQADGFYYPPNWRPEFGSISKFQGSKGSNQYQTHGIIRFELPFDGWCCKCEKPLTKGLRFNAKKDRDGKYFSTTIFSFSMKCYNCSNPIIIKTDPKNSTYDYFQGIRKMEHDYNANIDEDHVEILEEKGHKSLEKNPLQKLETELLIQNKFVAAKEHIDDLIQLNEIVSKDNYSINSYLRSMNRDKKRYERDLLREGEKRGISIPMLELGEYDDDIHESKRIKFHHNKAKVHDKLKKVNIISQSIFGESKKSISEKKDYSLSKIGNAIAKQVSSGINMNNFQSNFLLEKESVQFDFKIVSKAKTNIKKNMT